MILSVHATFGAAIASLIPTHPIGGFALGFLSHFILDAIPHRDYDLASLEVDLKIRNDVLDVICKKFRLIKDIVFVSLDIIVGLCLSFMFFFNSDYPWIFLIGVIGALLPDLFTFVYFFLKHKSLTLFLKFHSDFIHSKIFNNMGQVFGIFLQFCTITILIAIIFGLRSLY